MRQSCLWERVSTGEVSPGTSSSVEGRRERIEGEEGGNMEGVKVRDTGRLRRRRVRYSCL